MKKYNYEKLTKKYAKKNLINELRGKDYPIIPLSASDTIAQIGYGCNQKRIWCADYNLTPGVGLARNKKVTCDFLNNIGIPATISYTTKHKDKLKGIIEKIGFPLVMKPSKGTHGGKGVKVNILTEEEAKSAFDEIQKIEPKVHIEEYLKGADHRVLVINYKVIAVLSRVPANIISDGENNIKNQIIAENKRRENLPLEKKASLWEIPLDKTTKETLAKQDLTYESIPPKGEKVLLRFNSNVGTGGETIGMTKEIHPETKKFCEKAARLMDLRMAGIDIMTTDISKPMSEVGAKVIEVNTRPGIVMHQFPGSGDSVDTISIFAKEILGDPDKLWIPIKVNSKNCQDPRIIDENFESIPKKVMKKKEWQSLEIETIENPKGRLVEYLMDILTTEIEV